MSGRAFCCHLFVAITNGNCKKFDIKTKHADASVSRRLSVLVLSYDFFIVTSRSALKYDAYSCLA